MLFGHRSVQLQLGQVSVQPGQPLLRIYAERAAELEGDGLDEKVHADIGVYGRGLDRSARSTMSASPAKGAVSLSVMTISRQPASCAISASTHVMRE